MSYWKIIFYPICSFLVVIVYGHKIPAIMYYPTHIPEDQSVYFLGNNLTRQPNWCVTGNLQTHMTNERPGSGHVT